MKYSPDEIHEWYQRWPGQMLLEMEKEQVKDLLTHVFGDYLVQVGGVLSSNLLEGSPIAKKVYVVENPPKTEADFPCVQTLFPELPFLSNSVDVIFMPHLLSGVDHPYPFLDEAHRVLTPNGWLVILDLNPMSYWGLQKIFKKKQSFPWNGHFWSLSYIKHELRKLGFQMVMSKTFYFYRPTSKPAAMKRLLFWEALGQLCGPGLGGEFMVAAQKRVEGLTRIPEKSWARNANLSIGGLKSH